MLKKSLLTSALMLFVAGAAFGQNLPPVRVMGTVESVHGRTLVVKSSNGKTVSLALPADVRIIESVKGSVADIHPGDFVGSAAVKADGGRLRAQEVHIFAADMRGMGEGHRPMGPDPNRTMTNGDVAAVRSMTNGTVSGVSGSATRVLTITYKGGKQEIEVGPSTSVTRLVSGSEALLRAGVRVSIFAAKTNAGLTARMVSVERGSAKSTR
jgi:hypothetical protein